MTKIYGIAGEAVHLRVNGQDYVLHVAPIQTLAEVIRSELGLMGTKIGCGMGNCGACTVWLDGKPVYACLTLALDAIGHAVTTVEGLAEGELSALQQAFLQEDALQCGYCTSGQVMTLAAFLAENPQPDPLAIRHAMAGNLCRCGTYPKIVRAGLRAAGLLDEERVSKS